MYQKFFYVYESNHVILYPYLFCFQVDSSSLNDDLIGNNMDSRKKPQTPAPPMRIASFESKTLLDGKTNGN